MPPVRVRTCSEPLPKSRAIMKLKSRIGPSISRQSVFASPGKNSGSNGRSSRCVPMPSMVSSMPLPEMTMIQRSMPANSENGPSLATSAMLRRHSISPAGEAAFQISVVMPPPFFQGMR